MRDLALRQEFAAHGVHFPDTAVSTPDPNVFASWRRDLTIVADQYPDLLDRDTRIALDAQPVLNLGANAGIPAFLTNIVDPQVVRVFFSPMIAAELLGEVKKGDWTTLTGQFPIVESTGTTASYGDYNNNGTVGTNARWENRQSYHFQTIKKYGERQVAIWGKAGIGYAAEQDLAAAFVMAKFRNRSYFYGIANLANYGILNDPSLTTPLTPATKAAGGTTWALATADEQYQDFVALYTQLQIQMGGNLKMTDPMTLVMSTTRESKLAKLSAFNVSTRQMIKENFPNLTIKVAPEYTTGSGELMQLILPNYEGVQTGYAAFTEKFRTHPLVTHLSAWSQKISAGTWGAIIRRPVCIAQMLGI